MEGEIIPTPGHSDDSVSLILDEGISNILKHLQLFISGRFTAENLYNYSAEILQASCRFQNVSHGTAAEEKFIKLVNNDDVELSVKSIRQVIEKL